MDDRKLRILAAVVDEYIVTGEPVGSKAIMKYINASSATIRNEMAELEKQGYLEQPHTSAGRVPTYSGYRLYVDRLMKTNPLSSEEMKLLDDMLPKDEYSEEGIVKSASNALAAKVLPLKLSPFKAMNNEPLGQLRLSVVTPVQSRNI